ncbi:Nucleoid-associated protein YgaU, contains BON and LysM domains [Celeribacter baekdonensis]|uniref:Nucleoid-associated protein YgaU, contains BON and LysM domains n=1 Tax=Celeribacter baekdonensis TaxID=875171 RepID=A0A1G7FER5_9RHOB|nr:LysM peptidoglycan-binding domain-containing protein [Celeribacter baekdonensis]SDE74347.1 Nucleoid-associated protein YgaU, contains BON and LysM domains [Celeribacter baekdonensis]
MKDTMGKTQGWMTPVATVVAIGLVAGIGYTLYVAYPGGDAPSAPAALTSEIGVSEGGTGMEAANTVAPANPANQAPTGQETAPAGVVQSYPAFDLVRIPPDGLATVAGRAEAGAEVAILVDGQEVARTSANGRGEFVALFDLAGSDSPREMRLRSAANADTPDSSESVLDSAESVIIAPFAAVPDLDVSTESAAVAVDGVTAETGVAQNEPGDVAAASATGGAVATSILRTAESGAAVETAEPGEQSQTDPTPETTAESTEENTAENASTPPVAPPVAPTVMIATDEGVKVLQQPGTEAGALRIDAVTYDPEGRVFVSGRGAPGQSVRLYLMEALKAESLIGADGQWRQELSDVAPGRYTLRADQVDATGRVSQRAEIPFHREDVAVLAGTSAGDAAAPIGQTSAPLEAPHPKPTQAATPTPAPTPTPVKRIMSVTVQPGNTLWGIASATYGNGVMYVRVFDANKSQIRDADLIYPGQIFVLPE